MPYFHHVVGDRDLNLFWVMFAFALILLSYG